MVKKIVAVCMLIAGTVIADPVTLINQNDTWQYSVLSTDLNANWASAGYSSVNWSSLSWSSGKAAFGNSTVANGITNTNWSAGTDLALQKEVVIDGQFDGLLTLNLAVDNGAMVFVNGTQIFKQNAEGFTSIWEYSSQVNSSPFVAGKNTISVLAEDHGGLTYFDMELKGNITKSVPEPSSVSMALIGLLGLAGSFVNRRRK